MQGRNPPKDFGLFCKLLRAADMVDWNRFGECGQTSHMFFWFLAFEDLWVDGSSMFRTRVLNKYLNDLTESSRVTVQNKIQETPWTSRVTVQNKIQKTPWTSRVTVHNKIQKTPWTSRVTVHNKIEKTPWTCLCFWEDKLHNVLILHQISEFFYSARFFDYYFYLFFNELNGFHIFR